VGGLGDGALQGGIETALRRDRLVVALSLAGVIELAWIYLWRAAASMHAAEADPAALALTFAMWVVMMAGMMLPGAAPAVLLYGAMVRKHAERATALPAVGVFVSGYLLVWAAFGVAAALLQAVLANAALLTPMMASAIKPLNGVLFLAAGLYQLTPLKERCLGKCRNPVQFFMTHWRPGTAGALRMGATHGAYCVGCCWMLMLILFAVGVMNLVWVALIAAFVLFEKLLPAGRLTSRLAGGALIVVGLAVLGGAL
jgi:predicted metal-binding membrane protein